MNNALKYIVGILIAVLTLVLITLALTGSAHQKKDLVFTGIAIENDSPQGRRFLEDEELMDLVKQRNGNIVGRKVSGFDIKWSYAMPITGFILLGWLVSFSFGCVNVHNDSLCRVFSTFKGLIEHLNVMSIVRTHVRESEIIE